uniref:Uncharacterized protein n=1 Tax=Arundo donax TaxID=35708 RepID=A0A0A9DP51_ARUDO
MIYLTFNQVINHALYDFVRFFNFYDTVLNRLWQTMCMLGPRRSVDVFIGPSFCCNKFLTDNVQLFSNL